MKTTTLFIYTGLLITLITILYFIVKDIIKHKDDKKNWIRYSGGVGFAIALLFTIFCGKTLAFEPQISNDSNITKVSQTEIISKPKIKLTDSIVYDYMLKLNIEHPKVVLAQAKIESASYTSNVYNNTCNLFGMGLARSRASLAIGSYKGYSVFESWELCVVDYALFQSRFLHGLSEEEYLNKLQKTYAENPNYRKTLVKKISELKVESKL
jgi:hypothetical protein